jgi:hypothetical protein
MTVTDVSTWALGGVGSLVHLLCRSGPRSLSPIPNWGRVTSASWWGSFFAKSRQISVMCDAWLTNCWTTGIQCCCIIMKASFDRDNNYCHYAIQRIAGFAITLYCYHPAGPNDVVVVASPPGWRWGHRWWRSCSWLGQKPTSKFNKGRKA